MKTRGFWGGFSCALESVLARCRDVTLSAEELGLFSEMLLVLRSCTEMHESGTVHHTIKLSEMVSDHKPRFFGLKAPPVFPAHAHQGRKETKSKLQT